MLNAAAPQHKEVTHNQHGTRLIGWQARQLHNPLRTGKAKRGARAFARLFRHSSAFPHRHTCQQHPIHGNPGNKATWSHTMLHSCEFPSDLAIDLPGPSQPLRLQIADPISPHLPFTRRHWGSKGSHACSCATPQLGLCRALSVRSPHAYLLAFLLQSCTNHTHNYPHIFSRIYAAYVDK